MLLDHLSCQEGWQQARQRYLQRALRLTQRRLRPVILPKHLEAREQLLLNLRT